VTDGSSAAAFGTLMMLIPVWLCWRAVPAVIRLRRGFGKSFRREAISRWRIPRSARVLKLIPPAAALLCLVAVGIVVMLLGALIARGVGAGIALRPFARRINAQYRRLLQILTLGAQEIRARDQRPGILLLHSFMDDDLPVERPFRLFSSLLQVKLSLEELIVERIWRLGPVFAIGKPKELLSPLGAPREYLEGSLWQPEVDARLQQSAAVVSVLGETEGILWEYRRVLERRKSLLVVAPPATPAVMLSRWKNFCAVFPPAAAVPLAPDGNSVPLLAWFPLASETAVWFCREQNETAYTLAFDEFFRTASVDAPQRTAKESARQASPIPR
jgi:hypothetical protein